MVNSGLLLTGVLQVLCWQLHPIKSLTHALNAYDLSIHVPKTPQLSCCSLRFLLRPIDAR
jgi:hypothetical protein